MTAVQTPYPCRGEFASPAGPESFPIEDMRHLKECGALLTHGEDQGGRPPVVLIFHGLAPVGADTVGYGPGVIVQQVFRFAQYSALAFLYLQRQTCTFGYQAGFIFSNGTDYVEQKTVCLGKITKHNLHIALQQTAGKCHIP